MTLDDGTVGKIAEQLLNAELRARAVLKISVAHPNIDCDDAYAIQAEIRRRKQAHGQRVAGMKADLTSHAKMSRMGVDTPVFGLLFDYMNVVAGGEVATAELIRPQVEAEVAFVLKAALRGPGCDVGAVLAATDFVVPALEIIDSRYRGSPLDAQSVIADNASASRFVPGSCAVDIAALDLPTVGIVLEKNGKVAALAAGAAVLGHPAAAVAMLANTLAMRGEELPAGSFVMSGGATEAIGVAAGDVISARFQALGSVSVRVV